MSESLIVNKDIFLEDNTFHLDSNKKFQYLWLHFFKEIQKN